jgi:hypothetical protein
MADMRQIPQLARWLRRSDQTIAYEFEGAQHGADLFMGALKQALGAVASDVGD